jgi:hypothetical protein
MGGKKVKLSLCLTNQAQRHEGVWGSGYINPRVLDLGTSWRWVVSFTPRPLYRGERAPDTHWIGGWVDPRVGLDEIEKWKFLTLPGLELRPSLVQPIASHYTDCSIPAHGWKDNIKMCWKGRSVRVWPRFTRLEVRLKCRAVVNTALNLRVA